MEEQLFASREQSHFLLHGKDAVNIKAKLDNEVSNRSNPLEAALWFVTYIYLDHIDSAGSNNNF